MLDCSSSAKLKSSVRGWMPFGIGRLKCESQRGCATPKPATSADWAPIDGDVSEMRVDFGPGFRLYFTRRGSVLVAMLCGGDKSTQKRDIRRAIHVSAQLGEDI